MSASSIRSLTESRTEAIDLTDGSPSVGDIGAPPAPGDSTSSSASFLSSAYAPPSDRSPSLPLPFALASNLHPSLAMSSSSSNVVSAVPSGRAAPAAIVPNVFLSPDLPVAMPSHFSTSTSSPPAADIDPFYIPISGSSSNTAAAASATYVAATAAMSDNLSFDWAMPAPTAVQPRGVSHYQTTACAAS